MPIIFEIKILGRGGQGGKSIGEIIAKAAIDEGKFVQAFPEYGAERKGAPVKAFVRISDEEILLHTDIEFPDLVVVIDETLLNNPALVGGLKKDCRVVVNTMQPADEIKRLLDFTVRVFAVDANKIAFEELGNARHSNTAMLGAILKIEEDLLCVDDVKHELAGKFAKKLSEETIQKNIKALERGFNEVK